MYSAITYILTKPRYNCLSFNTNNVLKEVKINMASIRLYIKKTFRYLVWSFLKKTKQNTKGSSSLIAMIKSCKSWIGLSLVSQI